MARCPQCGNENRPGARFCDGCGERLELSETASVGPAPARVAAPPEDAPESVAAGRFEINGFLGRGTRKRVYLARDRERDGALTAVSTFNTEGMAETAQARSRREVEAMTTLGEHPHLVSVVASGEDGPRPFIASEYMPGGDLGDLLASRPERRLPVERAVAIATDVAAGLEHAHRKGIVHRDIKPANVWLDSAGSAQLGDFGLAAGPASSREGVERMVVGTAAYLPPEQAIGRPTDERADLYSLGALLYEMLAGEPPFPGDDPVTIISRHLSAEPVPPSRRNPDVSPELDSLVLRLLAKSPADRPAGAAELQAELARVDLEAGTGEATPEATPLEDLAGGVFVGREEELESLKEIFEGALAGQGGVALIEGEPGIGKTRLAQELVTYARVRGALVLSSACHEAETAPAYWPFAQAIRAYVREADPVGLAWQLGADGPEVARLVPELRERVPSIPAAPPLEGQESRFRFFEAIAGLLIGISSSRPLVLVLDDLHWADSSSIELLRFLAHRIAGNPLLLIGAYRPEEAAARGNLTRAFAELDAVPNRRQLVLNGLSGEAIGRFFELTAGEAAAPELLEEIAEQTGGNPFFVGEVVRLIVAEGELGSPQGAGLRVPHGVREAVRRRIGGLPGQARQALEAAAVIGREFDPRLVAAVLDRPVDAELDQARAARIVEAARGADGNQLFAHAVFREALYEGVESDRRAQLHVRAVAGIERLHAGDLDPQLPALARHSIESAPLGSAQKAFDYVLAAGRQAAGQLAHADAAEHLERALQVWPRTDATEELALRLELGEEMTRCGRFTDARKTLLECAELARTGGDAARLAEAAIALGAIAETGKTDRELASLCEEALELLGEDDPATSSRVLSVLAQEQIWRAVDARTRSLSDRAVELAHRAGDDAALASALAGRQFIDVGSPGLIGGRLAGAQELLEVSRRSGDATNEVRAQAYILTAQLQAGDIAAADRALAEYTALAERLREPRHLWHVPVIRATREIMKGRFAAARQLCEEGARLGSLAEEPLSEQLHVIQMATIHALEGSPEEMLPLIRRMTEAYPAIPAWRLALIGFLLDADRLDEARTEFEPVAAAGFELPRDANWLTGLGRITEVAARLGDVESCRELRERLSDFSGEMVVVGRSAVFNGPVERYLGMASATIGDHETAVSQLEAAVVACERMGERPLRAESRYALGQALLARDAPGDREHALEALGLALDQGQEMGMRKLVERAVRARLEAQGAAGVDVDASIDSVALAVSGERPDLGSFASADGRVTILFSDIENSTLITERLGDERWIEVLRAHNAVFRRRVIEHRGYEVKNQGDGFMLVFPDPLAALECAAAVQRDLAGEVGTERVRVRIGMHVGEAIQSEGDLFGRSVILAARIAAQARGGEILASEALREAGADAFGFDSGRELELKGLAGTHRVFRADWEPVAALAAD